MKMKSAGTMKFMKTKTNVAKATGCKVTLITCPVILCEDTHNIMNYSDIQ